MFLLLLLFQLVVDIFLLICNTCFHLCSINYKNNLLGLKFDFTLSYTFWWKEILVLMGHVYFSIMIYAFVSLRKSSICKTQNSGLRPKEEKPRDPMNQPSRCNTQEGLLAVAQTGWLWSPGRQSTPNSKLGKRLRAKNPTLSAYYIRVTKWLVTCLQSNPIGTNFSGYMFTKQFYWYNFAGFCSNLKQSHWYKLRGLLFKLRAILLVQTARAFVQT